MTHIRRANRERVSIVVEEDLKHDNHVLIGEVYSIERTGKGVEKNLEY